MHSTKNDLPQKIRAKVAATLADRLADATDLMLQTKQAHWNARAGRPENGGYNGHPMTTVTVTQARDSLLELLRAAQERGEAVQITRNGRPAGVLISAEEWESLIETVEILSDPNAMRKIRRARAELREGRTRTHEEVWEDALPASLPARRGTRPSRAAGRRAQKSAARTRAAGRGAARR